jgi:hypothetical protein
MYIPAVDFCDVLKKTTSPIDASIEEKVNISFYCFVKDIDRQDIDIGNHVE